VAADVVRANKILVANDERIEKEHKPFHHHTTGFIEFADSHK